MALVVHARVAGAEAREVAALGEALRVGSAALRLPDGRVVGPGVSDDGQRWAAWMEVHGAELSWCPQGLLVEAQVLAELRMGGRRNEIVVLGGNGGRAAARSSLQAAVVVQAHETVAAGAERLLEALRRRVQECAEQLAADAASGKVASTLDLTFWPPGCREHLTVRFRSPAGLAEPFGQGWEDHADARAQRAALAARHGLDPDLPSLRASCALEARCAAAAAAAAAAATGPGALVSPSRAAGLAEQHGLGRDAECALVLGDWIFCHYLQQGTEDRGWGCAYRSLQSAASWYVLSGWRSAPAVPSVEGIQQVLCRMGVMGDDFKVGCKQWIGSQEVAWVLNELYGAESRFLFCKGSEVGSLAGDLQEHFGSSGAPIICCGARLALTLVGVARDPVTCSARFLIADPHYTGKDRLQDVLGKAASLEGGFRGAALAWRSEGAAFKPSEAYTLVLPQRPHPASS